jgi:Flp pilus assembly protein TadG
MIDHRRGQVLVFFAVLLPVILLPLAAYAVDVSFVSTRAAGLEEATAQAAEAAAQRVSVDSLRSRSELTIDASVARAVVIRSMRVSDPAASVDSVVILGTLVTVTTQEQVALPFNFMPSPAVRLDARVSARLVAGYDSPSSRLPLPANTF